MRRRRRSSSLRTLSFDRTGQTARPSSTATELAADYGDDFDAVVTEHRIGRHIAFVAEHDTGSDGEEVRAVVPLFAFGRTNVLISGENGHLVDFENLSDCLPQVFVQTHIERPRFVPGDDRPTSQISVYVGVENERRHVEHRHYRVEVHEGVTVRQFDGDDATGLTGFE